MAEQTCLPGDSLREVTEQKGEVGAGPAASGKPKPLPKVPCGKAVLKACSGEPLAVREESVCAVGQPLPRPSGCRPGWRVRGPVRKWPGCRVSAGGGGGRAGSLGPQPQGSLDSDPTPGCPCRGVGRGVAGATRAFRVRVESLPDWAGRGESGGPGWLHWSWESSWPRALARGPWEPVPARREVALLGYHLPRGTAGLGAFLGW